MDGIVENAPLLVAQSGPLKGQRWTLGKAHLIGREPTCDVVIPDRMVSRFHARLSPSLHGIVLEDLGSKNGTHWNGNLISEKTLLEDGDIIQIALCQQFLFLTSDATVPLDDLEQTEHLLRIDARSRRVWINGILIDPPLSVLQYQVLHALFDRQGQVVPREVLVSSSWGTEQAIGVSDQALDALLRRLRERIAVIDPVHEYIVTIRGHGIRLDNSTQD